MSVDDIVKLLDAIAKLLNVLVWPAVLLFILIRFGRDLRDFIASLGELSVKGAGFEASLKRKQAEVAAALAAAVASRSDGDVSRESAAQEAKIAADIVSEVVTSRAVRRASRSTVLWVDDRPDNNIYERQALEALGVSFALATSTEEALRKISKQRFDAIISDMGRPPDSRAGYTLLDQLRASGDQTPFIIYASSRDPKHVAESRRHGAIGCTNNANELFEMVLSALGREYNRAVYSRSQ
jgi:CheY-like chemotaxis protein